MGGILKQSPGERQELDAAWKSHPSVMAFAQAALAYAIEHDLSYDTVGMNQMFPWSRQWFEDHGDWPHSGVVVG